MKTFNIDIPIEDKHTMLIDGVVQFDAGDKVQVTLLSNGTVYDFSESWTSLQLSILKPDGTAISTAITKDVTPTENPYELAVTDATQGRIDFVLQGQATIVAGTYASRLTLFDDDDVLCTSRINYHVEQNDDTISTDTSDNDYSVLKNLISTISGYVTTEANRVTAENGRVTAETGRVSAESTRVTEWSSISQRANAKIAEVDEIVEECETYAERAETAAAPSTTAITNVLQSMGWPNVSELNTRIATAIANRLAEGLNGCTVTINVGIGQTVSTLPTASASTMGRIYLVATATSGTSDEYMTAQYQEYSGYTSFDDAEDYIGYYILDTSNVSTLVTEDNYSSLSIVAGTTKAYTAWSSGTVVYGWSKLGSTSVDSNNIPVLAEGELWMTTDTFNLYIGTSSGNAEITQHYGAGSTSPSRTDFFWVDTGNNNMLKVYQNSAWTTVSATAVFS